MKGLSRKPPVKKLVPSTLSLCGQYSVEGCVAMNPGLRLLGNMRNVVREDIAELKGKVAVIAGEGAGHEPFCCGEYSG
jgi:dihydroxyacetone kinase